MKQQYPDTDFVCDVAAGMRLPIHVAAKVKRWRSRKSLPDMHIFEQRGQYTMLQLELKSSSAPLNKKDGTLLKNEHLEAQQVLHIKMRNKGFLAMFTKGFDQTKAVVRWYMSGAEGTPPTYSETLSGKKELNIFEKM